MNYKSESNLSHSISLTFDKILPEIEYLYDLETGYKLIPSIGGCLHCYEERKNKHISRCCPDCLTYKFKHLEQFWY